MSPAFRLVDRKPCVHDSTGMCGAKPAPLVHADTGPDPTTARHVRREALQLLVSKWLMRAI
jgi:hypothetical protein